MLGFGFIFISGFALLPATDRGAITEAFYIRGVLTYAVGGGLVGLACYLGLVPFDPDTLRFDGIVRRHLEIMTGAGIVAGMVYWMIAGRNAGAWRAAVAAAAAAVAADRRRARRQIAAVILWRCRHCEPRSDEPRAHALAPFEAAKMSAIALTR